MDDNGATLVTQITRTQTHELDASAPGTGSGTPPPRYLIVLRGGLPGSMIRLKPGTNSVGRSAQNDVQIPEMSVSRQHAVLRVDPTGARVTDLGSSNGTLHNGRRLTGHATVALNDGDRLRFGPHVLVKYACPDAFEEHLQRELFERAVRDGLTGLYNHRYFQDQLPTLEQQTTARGLGLAILILDVDHFKRVNDTYGHPAGDLVLRLIAQVLRQVSRADDLVARYGGEEFVLALPVSTPSQAAERAERLRIVLAGKRISLRGTLVPITASIGVAYAPAGRVRDLASLVEAADAALYQAKAQGRNRVVFPGDPAEMSNGRLTTVDFPVSRQGDDE